MGKKYEAHRAKLNYLTQLKNEDHLLATSMASSIIDKNFSKLSFAGKNRLHRKITKDLKEKGWKLIKS